MPLYYRTRKVVTLCIWLIFLLTVLLFVWAPTGQRFPAAVLSSYSFAAVQSRWDKCRVILEMPLCPWNWALFVFFIQLVGLPLLIGFTGLGAGVLPHLPSLFAINVALVLDTVAFLTTCWSYRKARALQSRNGGVPRPFRGPDVSAKQATISAKFIGLCAVLGIVGLFLTFGNFDNLADYFNDPAFYRGYMQDLSSTWSGFFSILLRHFLSFAIVAAWCNWIDRGGCKSPWWIRGITTFVLIIAIVFSLATFNYNRGAVAVPLVAIASIVALKRDKVSCGIMVLAGMSVLVLAPVYALYRSGALQDVELADNDNVESFLIEKVDVSNTIQMYGAAPQYLGYLLEQSHWGSDIQLGKVLLSSVLSPVPVAGKSFRESSGTAIYNRMIYGTSEIQDQVVPFTGESFLDLSVAGVLLGFCVIGWAVSRLQLAFERSRSSLEMYVLQYLAIWTCFLIFGSISVLSQILIYSCWPIYFYWFSIRSQATPNMQANQVVIC